MNDTIERYGWPLNNSQRRFAVVDLGGEQQAALECIRRCAVWQDCGCPPSECPHWPVGIRCERGAFMFPEQGTLPEPPRAVPVEEADCDLAAVAATVVALLFLAAVAWLAGQALRLIGG